MTKNQFFSDLIKKKITVKPSKETNLSKTQLIKSNAHHDYQSKFTCLVNVYMLRPVPETENA